MTIESQGAQTTATPISLNFTSGLTVADDGHGNETIATCFASVKDYGAKGDGTTNDAAAFTAAAAAGVTIFIPPGTYKLSSSVTFPNPVVFLAGAVIAPASATTTTFNGGIVAPVTAIFSLTGSAAIAFTPATQLVALAEWWGAVTYGAGAYPVELPTYSDVAIQAAVNAGAASVQLMGARLLHQRGDHADEPQLPPDGGWHEPERPRRRDPADHQERHHRWRRDWRVRQSRRDADRSMA